MRKKHDKINNYIAVFNPTTGEYLRLGNATFSQSPDLIDIGIMGECKAGKIGLCAKAGVSCYQSGTAKFLENMPLKLYQSIIEQAKDYVFQVALGGRGDPNHHENFAEILRIARENEIVPNYTTSGYGLTDEQIQLTKQYCGAVAVSWYDETHSQKTIDRLINAGVTTNIHYVLNRQSISKAKVLVDKLDKKINAIIFLLHKPVGLGTTAEIPTAEQMRTFLGWADEWVLAGKNIGFDSCCVSAIINHTQNINRQTVEPCEAARFSMYINAQGIATPCSFDQGGGVDLHHSTILQAWDSDYFEKYRQKFKQSCTDCGDRLDCLGGCPLHSEIAFCNRNERK